MTTDIVTPHSGSRFLTGDWRASVVTLVVVARHVCIVTETYPPEINEEAPHALAVECKARALRGDDELGFSRIDGLRDAGLRSSRCRNPAA